VKRSEAGNIATVAAGAAGLALAAWTAVGTVQPVTVAAADAPKVTFAKDVAPIFKEKCQTCHHPGTVAPMSLMTYQETRPWIRSIKERVAAREMPPWHLDKTVGIQRFKDDISLSDGQIATIISWVDAGAPMGDPKDLPTPLAINDDEWTIGKPDLIVSLPKSDKVYAKGPDWWVDRYVDVGNGEDRYIKAVETKVSVSGRRVVHHAIATLVQDADSRTKADSTAAVSFDNAVLDVNDGTYLSEYAVGKYGETFPDGSGRILKKGAKVHFNMHYHAIGEETEALTSVGFVFYPKGVTPKHFITDVFPHENDTIDIAPGVMTRTDAYYRLSRPARIVSFQPHMHMRGKAMCMEAIHLNGDRETLSCVDHFDFNWHVMYTYQDNVAPLLPAGTMLHLIAIHDNTVSNKKNPDPTLWVGWGQRSIDDMAAAHIGTEFLTDDDFAQQVAARKALQQKLTNDNQP
jgi:mono/diheme cytochrome c family protein